MLSDSRGQGRSGPQTAQFFVMFCGAGSSPRDVSTAVARALEEKSSALWRDEENKKSSALQKQSATLPRLDKGDASRIESLERRTP